MFKQAFITCYKKNATLFHRRLCEFFKYILEKKCTDCSLAFDNCLQHVQPVDDYVIVFMRYHMSNSSVCIL